MQFSVYDIITKINLMQEIIDKVNMNAPLEVHADDIQELLQEYSDILKCAKVKI